MDPYTSHWTEEKPITKVDDDGNAAPDINQDYSDVVAGYKKFRSEQDAILDTSALA
jgi:hypothetical protein